MDIQDYLGYFGYFNIYLGKDAGSLISMWGFENIVKCWGPWWYFKSMRRDFHRKLQSLFGVGILPISSHLLGWKKWFENGLEWFENGVSVFGVGNYFWQPYLCLKANIQMMYFFEYVVYDYLTQIRSSFM